MRRGTRHTLPAVLFAVLLFSVYVQAWLLPSAVESVVSVFPEVELLAVPSIMWGVLAIACWQGAAVIGLRLSMVPPEHAIKSTTDGWLRAMIGFLGAFVVLVASAFIALSVMGYATPGAMLGLIGGGLLALIAMGTVGLFLGTRPLLRHYVHA